MAALLGWLVGGPSTGNEAVCRPRSVVCERGHACPGGTDRRPRWQDLFRALPHATPSRWALADCRLLLILGAGSVRGVDPADDCHIVD